MHPNDAIKAINEILAKVSIDDWAIYSSHLVFTDLTGINAPDDLSFEFIFHGKQFVEGEAYSV